MKKILELTQLNETNQMVADILIRSRQQSAVLSDDEGTTSSQYTVGGTKIQHFAKIDDTD